MTFRQLLELKARADKSAQAALDQASSALTSGNSVEIDELAHLIQAAERDREEYDAQRKRAGTTLVHQLHNAHAAVRAAVAADTGVNDANTRYNRAANAYARFLREHYPDTDEDI